MEIQTLSSENLTPFVHLVLKLWDGDFEEEYAFYENLIHSENNRCLLVKNLDQYIAFIHFSKRSEYVEGAELPVAYIEGIYVEPEFQNKGIARLLVEEVETWAKNENLKQIASDTDWENSHSIAFHEKLGFKEVERIVCFIKNLD